MSVNKNETFCDVEFFINVPLFLTPGQPLWGLVMFRQSLKTAICVHSHPTGKLQSHHLKLFLFPPYLLPPKPKSCGSAEVDVARKLLRWALTHLITARDREGRCESFYYLHRCGRGSALLCLHRGSLIGAIHISNRTKDLLRVMRQEQSIKPQS